MLKYKIPQIVTLTRYDCQPMLDGLHLETKIYEKSTVIN